MLSLLIRSVTLQDDVAKAAPEIERRTEEMVSQGRWMVPGYRVSYRVQQIANIF